MGNANVKDAVKVTQGGLHAPEKDFSSKKSQAKADGKSSTAPAVVAGDTTEKVKWEGSSGDWSADYAASKRRGKTVEEYDGTAHDRIADAAGQRRMDAEPAKGEAPTYTKGGSHFQSTPKNSHGYGHTGSARDGKLRCSGHSGAHRIGGKK